VSAPYAGANGQKESNGQESPSHVEIDRPRKSHSGRTTAGNRAPSLARK
jgi:hypothetical protein